MRTSDSRILADFILSSGFIALAIVLDVYVFKNSLFSIGIMAYLGSHNINLFCVKRPFKSSGQEA
jgi:hypothetical protein